ncbi:nucleotidyltransferase family protein [Alginatibacterium sediminis]|uniref:Nucleotidyltransferase family protein n=1 Tax=Alginatibacterium sediminis TaxID=2164068 RepID=A0A420E7R8_9ALTE|nr:nucleotidyltransferase family protein [Alginatibacterium sediminis]RKF14544.1 nucleotidyltransferase family protein [Alginatibacterium sediminis]
MRRIVSFDSPRIKSAIILAAGRGSRMRELTDNCPKPLLNVNGKCLIDFHIEALLAAGISSIVINCAYLKEQIVAHVQAYIQQGYNIQFSIEGDALETAGGIKKAWNLLEDEQVLVVNADIWTDVDYRQLIATVTSLPVHLWLVDNPEHNPKGDFDIVNGLVADEPRYTFSGIGIYRKHVVADLKDGPLALAPVLRELIARAEVSGELLQGKWIDVGTPERLSKLNAELQIASNN